MSLKRIFISYLLAPTLMSISLFFSSSEGLAQDKNNPNTPTFGLSGHAQLTSHFVHKGLSYTNKDPGLNTSFFFNLGPQFKFGFFGSNVKLDDAHLWLSFRGEVKINFSQSVEMDLYYHDDHYFRSSERNGNLLGTKLFFSGVKAQFEMLSNWEGTQARGQYYATGYDFNFIYGLLLGTHLGYTTQNSEDLKNYFDARIGLIYKTNRSGIYDVFVTTTSAPSQFANKRGQTAYGVSASFEF